MLHTIVEGEPGIFPDPVARVMRTIGGWFGRRSPAEPGTGPEPSGGTTPTGRAEPGDVPAPPARPDDEGHPAEPT